MQTTTKPVCPVVPLPVRNAGNIRARFLKLVFLPFLLFLCGKGDAMNKVAISNNGNGWSADANWAPFGVPAEGDIVIIPGGITIDIKGNVYGTPPDLTVIINGTLNFEPSGKLDLGPNSQLNLSAGGRITSHGSSSELVKIGGVTKFNGQVDGTITGPSYASSATGASPAGFSQGTLAIKLYSFQAKRIGNSVRLDWTASSDDAGDVFSVQKSTDAVNWYNMMSLPAINLYQVNAYQYTDQLAGDPVIFYRLLLLNTAGQQSFSRTIPVVNGTDRMKLFPNPSVSETRITWGENTIVHTLFVELFGFSGELIKRNVVPAGDQFFVLDTKSLPPGRYTLRLTDHNAFTQASALIVGR